MIKSHRKGSVLIMVLLFLSLMSILIEHFSRTVWIGTIFSDRMVLREQAEMLAISGMYCAADQLTRSNKAKTENKNKDKAQTDKEERATFFKRILPTLNKWQDFTLTKSIDGLDGTLKICLSCEEGKINLNQAFDFEKKVFKKEYDAILSKLGFAESSTSDKNTHSTGSGQSGTGETGPNSLGKKIADALKKNESPLNDLSQIPLLAPTGSSELFYAPPEMVMDSHKKMVEKPRAFALFDVFTLWSDVGTVNPLFFSDGMCAALSLKRPSARQNDELNNKMKTLAEQIAPEWAKDWKANWAQLKPIYEHDIAIFDQISSILATEIEPKVYSVISSGQVKDVEQRLMAILRIVEEEASHSTGSGQSGQTTHGQAPQRKVLIERMYWIDQSNQS